MNPSVFTPAFVMCSISASAMMSSFCVVLNTQRFFSSIGSTTAACRRRQHRRLRLGDELEHAHRIRRARRPDQRVDLLLGNQLLHVGDALRRIARVVEIEVFDRRVADTLRQQRDRILLRNADERRRTGRRRDDADLHLRVRARRDHGTCSERRERAQSDSCGKVSHPLAVRAIRGLVRRIASLHGASATFGRPATRGSVVDS